MTTNGDQVPTYVSDDEGHYLVAIGYDDEYVYFEDPSLKSVRGRMTYADFLKRWHDEGGHDDPEGEESADSTGGRKYIRFGIAVWRPQEVADIKGLHNHLTKGKRDQSGHCHDEEGHWVGCDTPGAITSEGKPANASPGKRNERTPTYERFHRRDSLLGHPLQRGRTAAG